MGNKDEQNRGCCNVLLDFAVTMTAFCVVHNISDGGAVPKKIIIGDDLVVQMSKMTDCIITLSGQSFDRDESII